MRSTRPLAAALAIALSLPVATLAVTAVPASAAPPTTVVDEWNDELNADGDCSLREAVESLNTASDVDGCVLGAGEIIDLPAGLFTLDDPLVLDVTATLRGVAPVTTAIDCSSTVGGCIEMSGVGADLTVRSLQVSGGTSTLVYATSVAGNVRIEDVVAYGGSDGIITNGGAVTVLDSSVWDSDRFGIASSTGDLNIYRTVVGGHDSAGVFSEAGGVVVSASVIRQNEGVGLRNVGGSTVVSTTTVEGNGVEGVGTDDGNLDVSSSTIVGNGVGVHVVGGGTARFTNTVLADHDLGNCDAPPSSDGFNVSDDGTCAFAQASDRNDLDPGLAPLDVLGASPAFPLLDGSPLIDTGGECLPTDQLGAVRPTDGNGDGEATCDVGAIERAGIAGPADDQPTDPTDPGTDPTDEPVLPSAEAARPVSARPTFTG